MTKRKPKRRSPREADQKKMRALGYVTPAEAGALGGALGATTAHGWVRRGVLQEVNGKKPAVHVNGVLWILAEAVKLYRPRPADLVRAE